MVGDRPTSADDFKGAEGNNPTIDVTSGNAIILPSPGAPNGLDSWANAHMFTPRRFSCRRPGRYQTYPLVPDSAMKRPFLFAAQVSLGVALSLAAAAAAAGGASGDGSRHAASNSFNLVYGAKSPGAAVVVPSNGTSLPPGKAVVSNPYNVPLFKDAGSLGAR